MTPQVIPMDEYSRIYARYVVDLNYDDLPADVVEKTKMRARRRVLYIV